ncbi:sulfotransferase [Nitrosopumilus oxyclinae]|uniref:Sulfotransferase n=1 Tax=Nitrosopumilus oxyclinae TaxID=1959104 RepID=A0A7D5M0K2_9ARCH|nr:sulfotransferase domain-containing protein [Nitrosopumilus oxyclinae]QLH04006.1 sulfotransferase [Nitrosopumilus oxyclinae]
MYSGINNSNREKIRACLGNSKLYSVAKLIHSKYAKLSSNYHSLPDFLIIGAAKSGTSSLYEYLNQHPSILPCVVKEPNYFTAYYNRGLDWYKSCFPFKAKRFFCPEKKFLTGEATARYYWYPFAPERVKQLLPNCKIILLLRNPVERSYSHYKMRYKNKIIDQTFEQEILDEPKRIEGEWDKMLNDENYFSFKFNSNGYLTKGLYINYITKWFELFPKKQILVIKAEDFFSNPEKITNETLEFLGLPSIKLKNYEIMRKGLDDKLTSDIRKKLIDYFKPYNQKLYDFLNVDFGWDK